MKREELEFLMGEALQQARKSASAFRRPALVFLIGMGILLPGILLTHSAATTAQTLGWVVAFTGFAIVIAGWALGVVAAFRRD